MEHYKISKLLNESTVSKFVKRKWIEVNNLSGDQYSVNKNIRHKTPILRSYLCDYSDAYIVVKRTITIEGTNENYQTNKELAFKDNAPFRWNKSNIKSTLVDNAEDLNIAMSIYYLLRYSDNYSMTSKGLWNYYRD